MSERPKASLVRTIEYGKSRTYIFSCVDCGKEFVRSANNRRINPYCGDCQRRYDKIKNAENKAKRQAEHDKQIRADAINSFLMWLYHSYNVTMIAGECLDDLFKKYGKEQTNCDNYEESEDKQ